MALVYKRSDRKTARAYERSSGMEPNPGVTHLTVVGNPGKRGSVRGNPFQWIEGRGQRHRHVSKPFNTIRRAAAWKKRRPKSKARLYPVDEQGTLVSRPISKELLSNRTSRRTGMAYNIGALRRAMRSNPKHRSPVHEEETAGGVKVRSNGRRKSKPKPNRSRTKRRSSVAANKRRRRSSRRKSVAANKRRRSRRTSRRRGSRRKVAANKRRRSRRSSRRTSAAPKRRRSRRRTTANRRGSRRYGRAWRPVRRNTKRTSRRRASAKKRGGKRRTSRGKYYWGRKRVTARGKEYLDKYLMKGYMPSVAPVYHTGSSKSGAPAVLVYPIPAGQGRLSKRKTKRRTSYKRGGVTKRRRSRAVGATYRGRRARRMAANKRRRSSRRRSSKPGMYKNRRRSRRGSRRGSRRSSRRGSRRRLTRNLLSTSKVQWGGRGKYRAGRPRGKRHQVVMYGSKSKGRPGKGGKRRRVSGYPVYVPGHVVERASVRRFKRLGGGAKDAHEKAKRRGYSERRWPKRRVKRNTRRTSMSRNRRNSRRKGSRRSTRRNPRWVVANKRRRRRRLRKNQFFGADLMKDVVTPVIGGTAGFVAARVLSNGLANIEGLRNLLDKDKPAAEASNTKIAANVLGIVATLGLGTKVKLVKDHQGALITGMGLALADRLLGQVTGEAAQYLSGFGEYVSQPLGEYVSQPLGAYVGDGMGTLYATAGMGTMEAAAGVGEYVSQPLGAYAEGVDPADQGSTDSLMDTMEAAAGMGETLYATAGMGETLYAAAGLGAEADASLQAMYRREQIPFHSIHTPTGVARPVSATLPFSRPVPTSMVTPEGKGYAGGLFARHLFAGMF